MWSSRSESILRWATYLALALGGLWLGYQFWRLCFQPLPRGAVDLLLRHQEVVAWFKGGRIYWHRSNAVYPPASYLMLAPLGWVTLETARYLWAILSAAVLLLLARAFERRCLAEQPASDSSWRSRFLFVLPLALYPFGAGIGNGQNSMLVVACLFACLVLQEPTARSWKRDMLLACVFLVALIKPSIAAFFFWIVLLTPGGMRRGAMVVGGYAALTYVSSTFQKFGPIRIMRAWSRRAIGGAEWGATQGEGSIRKPQMEPAARRVKKTAEPERARGAEREAAEPERARAAEREAVEPDAGEPAAVAEVEPTPALPEVEPPIEITHINLHSFASILGREEWILVGSIVVLFGLGLWVFLHRRCSVWVLAGVTAIVARFAMYHGWYDDVMLLFPLVSLFRLSLGASSFRGRVFAGWAFALMALSLLAPGGVYLLPHPWDNVYVVAQAGVWFAVLAFLVGCAWRERKLVRMSS